MPPSRHLILGPPGTGKTTHLLEVIESKLERGTAPERIAYYSFTRAATREAIERACDRFGFRRAQLPHFRTLHSESWRSLQDMGYTPDLLTDTDLRLIGATWKARFLQPAFYKQDEESRARGTGDVYLHLYRLCRSMKITPTVLRAALGEEFFRPDHMVGGNVVHKVNAKNSHTHWTNFEEFYREMLRQPDEHMKMDYPDLIDLAVKVVPPLPIDVGVVDEAQDLSRQQWDLCWALLADCKEMFIAGDDDQAIYQWSGADLRTFRDLGRQPNTDIKVLEKSWRLPRTIFDVAQTLNHRIKDRYEKDWHPRDDEGEVRFQWDLRGIPVDNGEPWMILARNDKFLKPIEKNLRKRGIAYSKNGRRSVKKQHWDAIRFWTRLTKRGTLSPAAVRVLYDFLIPEALASEDDREKGQSLPDEVGDVNMRYLQDNCGLLPASRNTWIEVLNFDDERVAYYRQVLRLYGAAQLAEPLINLSTIHAVKGAECDNVVVLRSMSKATWDNFQRDPDSEHRVFYVAVTRAKKRLYVVRQSKAKYHYP